MNYSSYYQLLLEHGEPAYAAFSQPLSHSSYKVIGVRIPILRQLIKANYPDLNLQLCDFVLGKTLEVDFSYFAIGLLRCKNTTEQLTFLKQNLKIAQSWMITDMLNSYLKKVNFEEFWAYFLSTYQDEHLYTRRFAYVFGLKFYRDERILQILPYMENEDEYLVTMGRAWLLATIAICYPQAILSLLKSSLPGALKNKTISKINESFRIDTTTKKQFTDLRKLK